MWLSNSVHVFKSQRSMGFAEGSNGRWFVVPLFLPIAQKYGKNRKKRLTGI